jgi:cytoskeletal protein RodZ
MLDKLNKYFIEITIMIEEKIAKKDFLDLRKKREALGLTIRDVFRRTRISVINLEAIENGDFHRLPVQIYTKNFIKMYARALEIDSKPIMDSYEAYLNSLQIADTQSPESIPEKESFFKRFEHHKTYIWITSAIIVVVVVAFLFSNKSKLRNVPSSPQKTVATEPSKNIVLDLPENKSAIEGTQEKPASSSNEPKKNVAEQPSKAVTKQVLVPAQKIIPAPKLSTEKKESEAENKQAIPINEELSPLIIRASEETWLRIKIDQNPSFQVLLKPGEKIERKGADFDIDVGNAGGIKLQFRGKTIENMGKSGEVIHVRLP